MSGYAILSIILFIVIIILSILLNHENKEKYLCWSEVNREYVLRSALEYACNFPTLAEEDFSEIEKLLEQIAADKEIKGFEEEITRGNEAILAVYRSKQKGEGLKG